MKKIISFSLWGDNPKYVFGAFDNCNAQKILFPDWTLRFYIHVDVQRPVWEDIQKIAGAEVIRVDEPVSRGMLWRFRPMMDPDVSRFMVRDTDGIMTPREQAAVFDWIASKKSFHIIRDNPMHRTRIMGGMWGATKKVIDKIDYAKILNEHDFENTPNICGYDQDFLALKIYPLIKDDVCIHDDYHLYQDENPRRIPYLRDGNHYIGEPTER